MQNFFQLGVRDAEISAPDSRHTSDDGVFERIANGVSANHPSRAHNYQANLTRPRSIHPRLPVAAKALVEPIWLVAVMIMRVPRASPRRAGALETATSGLS